MLKIGLEMLKFRKNVLVTSLAAKNPENFQDAIKYSHAKILKFVMVTF